MTHRAETILDTIDTLLTGLATTGTNVERARTWASHTNPALTISKGADQSASIDECLDSQVRELFVNVTMHTQQTGNQETALNAIAAEVYAAMLADESLGLAFVFDTFLMGDTEPDISDSQDLPVGMMTSEFRILYEHSSGSAEA